MCVCVCVCVCSLSRVGRSLEASRIPDIGHWGMSLLVTDLHDETPKVQSISSYHTRSCNLTQEVTHNYNALVTTEESCSCSSAWRPMKQQLRSANTKT